MKRALVVDITLVPRRPVADLATGAWSRFGDLRLVDALYAALVTLLNAPLLTSDRKLARAWATAETPDRDSPPVSP